MLLRAVLIVCMQYQLVFPYRHEKPLPQSVWPAGCSANDRVINDCNWCVCKGSRYSCKARDCAEVDMFGHFNDAIAQHVVGMEGHGSWRSVSSPCSPRAHYRREGLMCVCNDDGAWPNPVCRDLFRALHEVEATGHSRPSALHACTPHRLYLYGCDVCLCPAEGRINPDACTRHNCSADDPVLLPVEEVTANEEQYELSEVYAECDLERKYTFGCMKCVCLKNNRLLCDDCDKKEINRSLTKNGYCQRRVPEELFNVDCNICVCDVRNLMYCTTRHCLDQPTKLDVVPNAAVDLTLRTVDPPLDSFNCTVGTKYHKDCNRCYCTESEDGEKVLVCSLILCRDKKQKDVIKEIQNDCVENTVYEKTCQLCRCDKVGELKRETCLVKSACEQKLLREEWRDLDVQRGYCEPGQAYRKDCNECHCLPDGRTVECSTRECAASRPLLTDVIPVLQHGATPCPRDHMYKIDCNFCFCLSNGNFLCTTADCDEEG